jgi:hypothetical protein
MAVSAVYCTIVRITRDGAAGERKNFSNISATTAAFPLRGGQYNIDTLGSTFGSVTLQRLGPDGSTFLNAASAIVANGAVVLDLPAGSYRLALA